VPAPEVKMSSKEDAAITARAKEFYRQVRGGSIDRAKVDDTLNKALNDDLLKTVSSQLSALGEPKWEFRGQIPSERGAVQVYRLVTHQVTLNLSFGLTKDGKVWDFLLSPER
jgi:hypothetical protein